MFIGVEFNAAQTVAFLDLLQGDEKDEFRAGVQVAKMGDRIVVVPMKNLTTPGRGRYYLNEDGTIDESEKGDD